MSWIQGQDNLWIRDDGWRVEYDRTKPTHGGVKPGVWLAYDPAGKVAGGRSIHGQAWERRWLVAGDAQAWVDTYVLRRNAIVTDTEPAPDIHALIGMLDWVDT